MLQKEIVQSNNQQEWNMHNVVTYYSLIQWLLYENNYWIPLVSPLSLLSFPLSLSPLSVKTLFQKTE